MRNPKVIVLWLLMGAAFADGVAHQLTAPGEMFGGSDVAFTLLATLLIFLWYRFDSDQLSYRRSPFLNVAVIALAVVALPFYFFRSRSLTLAFRALGLFIACCLAYILLQQAGAYAADYILQS